MIESQVAWIHQVLLGKRSTRILDLGCGPGLCTSRLARLGHTCVGMDCSPAAVRYAASEAAAEQLACRYERRDLRTGMFGTDYGLVMLIYAGLNLFSLQEARQLLIESQAALGEDGLLLLEPYSYEAVRRLGSYSPHWATLEHGMFCDAPHLLLTENFWDEATRTTTSRHWVVELITLNVNCYVQSLHAYTELEYRQLLAECGFGEVSAYPSLTGREEAKEPKLLVLTARRSPRISARLS